MNFLAVDTSASYLTVGVKKGEEEFLHYSENAGMKHSVLLMPAIDDVLKKSGLSLSDLDFFGVVVGAGSFTGIRIGVATVKALAKSAKKPVVPVTSFDTFAYDKLDGEFLALIDAKHGHYYAAAYRGTEQVSVPAYLSEAEVRELEQGRTVISCSPVAGFATEVVSPARGLMRAVEGRKDQAVPLSEVYPLYIRKSQAEEGR